MADIVSACELLLPVVHILLYTSISAVHLCIYMTDKLMYRRGLIHHADMYGS